MAKKTITKKAVEKPVSTEETKARVSDSLLYYVHHPEINGKATEAYTDEEKVCVEALDKAMVTLPDMELNRVTIPHVLGVFLTQAGVDNITDLVGKVVESVPYMSTTKKPLYEIVRHRYNLGLTNAVCFIVHTEGRAKGVDVVEALKAEGYGGGRAAKQQEVILARGTKFRVGKYVIGDEWGEVYPIIHLYAI